jgi:hypothetical protein
MFENDAKDARMSVCSTSPCHIKYMGYMSLGRMLDIQLQYVYPVQTACLRPGKNLDHIEQMLMKRKVSIILQISWVLMGGSNVDCLLRTSMSLRADFQFTGGVQGRLVWELWGSDYTNA